MRASRSKRASRSGPATIAAGSTSRRRPVPAACHGHDRPRPCRPAQSAPARDRRRGAARLATRSSGVRNEPDEVDCLNRLVESYPTCWRSASSPAHACARNAARAANGRARAASYSCLTRSHRSGFMTGLSRDQARGPSVAPSLAFSGSDGKDEREFTGRRTASRSAAGKAFAPPNVKEDVCMESRTKLFGHPVHPMLIVFPLGLLGVQPWSSTCSGWRPTTATGRKSRSG